MKIHEGISVIDIVDKDLPDGHELDSLVVENARLYELAQERTERLEKAKKEIKTLRGIIPICAHRKKKRNDEGYWQQVETYIGQNSDALFSHGLCPDCFHKFYSEHEHLIVEASTTTKAG